MRGKHSAPVGAGAGVRVQVQQAGDDLKIVLHIVVCFPQKHGDCRCALAYMRFKRGVGMAELGIFESTAFNSLRSVPGISMSPAWPLWPEASDETGGPYEPPPP